MYYGSCSSCVVLYSLFVFLSIFFFFFFFFSSRRRHTRCLSDGVQTCALPISALLLTPTRAWWIMLLAALPAHLAGELSHGIPVSMVLSWYISNSTEALIAAGAMRRFDRQARLDTFRRVVLFVLGGVLLGPFLSSFLDAAFVMWNHFGSAGYWEVWRTRF